MLFEAHQLYLLFRLYARSSVLAILLLCQRVPVMLRQSCALLKLLWKFIRLFFSRIFTKKGNTSASSSPAVASGGNKDLNWQSDEWEDFSVSVVPNQDTGSGLSTQEQDVFRDMQPVFKKEKKVHQIAIKPVMFWNYEKALIREHCQKPWP